MAVSYSRQAPVATAISWTFDGKHPCQLCHLAQKAAGDERQRGSLPATLRIEAATPSPALSAPLPPERPPAVFALVMDPSTRSDRPALPPPRLVPA